MELIGVLVMNRMILLIIRIPYLSCLFCLSGQIGFSQNYSSRNNYTGDWETPTSWNPTWQVPQTDIKGNDITINGYITLNGSLSFSGSPGNLIIKDTLVIKGNLSLDNNNDLIINDNGILIVRGNLSFHNHVNIVANGYIIITGDLDKHGPNHEGSFTSDDKPAKVFIGGTISPADLSSNEPDYQPLTCTTHSTIRYVNSNCSYGNIKDLMKDPIYPFYKTTLCNVATPVITASGPITFCTGNYVTLTSSASTNYLWSTGETTSSINVTNTGRYTVKAIDNDGCRSKTSLPAQVTVNESPVAVAGPDEELTFVFETHMKAVLAASESGEWSLISGSAYIEDIHSPTTNITELSIGENIFMWKVLIGNCVDSAKVNITVNDLIVPSVITPDGDGKNDFFKIGEFIDKVELIIINRWGNEEFTNSNYLNDWSGLNSKGQKLPNDTYFYILKFKNGSIKKGSVLIKR